MSEMNTPNPALAERLWQRHTLGQKLARTAFWLGIGIAVLLSLRNINVIWEFLWDAPEQMLDMVRRMFPPDYAYYRVARLGAALYRRLRPRPAGGYCRYRLPLRRLRRQTAR